jgi:hypothetical protein
VTGERLGQAGWLNSSEAEPKGAVTEAGFTSSSGDVRASSVNAKKELVRRGAMRNRSESGQVAREKFRARVNRSYPEGKRLLLCTSTGA